MNETVERSKINLRNLENEDIEIIYNHLHLSYVKKYFTDKLDEQWKIYKKWYEYMIEAPQYRLYFFEDTNKFIGFVSYELKNNKAIVNIYINKDYRGKKYAKILLKMSIDKLKKDTRNIKFIVAYILEENVVSQKTFLGIGFNLKKVERYNKIKYKMYKKYL